MLQEETTPLRDGGGISGLGDSPGQGRWEPLLRLPVSSGVRLKPSKGSVPTKAPAEALDCPLEG